MHSVKLGINVFSSEPGGRVGELLGLQGGPHCLLLLWLLFQKSRSYLLIKDKH